MTLEEFGKEIKLKKCVLKKIDEKTPGAHVPANFTMRGTVCLLNEERIYLLNEHDSLTTGKIIHVGRTVDGALLIETKNSTYRLELHE